MHTGQAVLEKMANEDRMLNPKKGFRNLRKPLKLHELRGQDLNVRPSGHDPDFMTFRRSLIRGLISPNLLILLSFFDSIWFDPFHRFRSFSICFVTRGIAKKDRPLCLVR